MGWHCDPSAVFRDGTVYKRPTAVGMDNCEQIYYILKQYNWTTNAICGVLTCIGFESGYNPWIWQGSIIPTTSNYTGSTGNKGYGLVQWTPGSYLNTIRYHRNKYIDNPWTVGTPGYGPNFADQTGSLYDGYAQTVFLATHAWSIDGVNKDYYEYSSSNYYSHLAPEFSDYIVSTAAAHDLCETWVLNFERPYDPTANRTYRQTCADYLWNHFNGLPVIPPDTPGGTFPAWLLLKWRQANMNRGRWY